MRQVRSLGRGSSDSLTGRPAETAAPQDVDVKVKHRLTGFGVGVDYGAKAAPIDLLLSCQTSRYHEQVTE